MYIESFYAMSFSSFLANLLKWVINLAFSIFVKLLVPLMEAIIAILKAIFNSFLYDDVLLPMLKMLDTMQEAVDIFAGVQTVKFNGEEGLLLNVLLFQSDVSRAFWAITLVGVAIAGIAGVASLSRLALSEKDTFGKVIGRLGKTMLTFLVVPFVVMSGLNLFAMVFTKAAESIVMSNETSAGVAEVIFATVAVGAEKVEKGEIDANNMFSGAIQSYVDGTKDYNDPAVVYGKVEGKIDSVGGDFEITNMNVLLGIVETLFFIFIYSAALIMFMIRIIEICILYVISPLFTGTIAFDDGEKFKQWRELFIAKILAGVGLILGMKLFALIIVPIAVGDSVQLTDGVWTGVGPYPEMTLRIIFLAASAYSVYKSFGLITQVVNPQAASSEGGIIGKALGIVTTFAAAPVKAVQSVVSDD